MSVRRRKWQDRSRTVDRWEVSIAGFKHADGRVEPRIRMFAPVNTRKAAEEFERQIRGALAAGTWGKEAAKPIPTVAEFVPAFLTESDNNNKPSTVDTKRTLLAQHLLPFFGKLKLDQIGLAEIEDFKALMKAKLSGTHVRQKSASKPAVKKRHGAGPKPLGLKSINNVLAVLRRMLSLAYEQGVIKHMPKVKFFKTAKPPFDFLDFEEAERMLASADSEWRTLILVALKTGLRKGELIGLHWTDIDLHRARLHVRRTLSKGREGTPKGGRSRSVELPPSVVAALGKARHLNGPFVFCQADGKPLSEGKMKMPLERALRRAGISRELGRIDWHDLRHSYGSHLAMRGVPIKAIQELMGHASIEMTMRYAHLSPQVRTHAVALLDTPASAPVEHRWSTEA